jgi:GNAT superfamily N-acetyltransferase
MQWGRWLELNLRGMQAAFASFARASGAQVLEREGVVAAINPAVRERSVFNSVVYLDPAALAAAREEITAAYGHAGCAWTVWVPERDTKTARLLEDSGHRLDARPRAMGIELGDVEAPDLSDLDWTAEGEIEQMAALNDAAYGFSPGTWIKGTGRDQPGLHVYLARVGGAPAATVCSRDEGGDCSIWNVATVHAARGQGLSTALMRQVLFDAAQRGCSTSTLQATRLGAPVYRRCGYQDFGALEMWELRPAELASDAHPMPPA